MPRRFPGALKGGRAVGAVPGSETYRPQLARLYKEPPEGPGWLHEIKWDGYRMGLRVAPGGMRLISRSRHDWSAEFPELLREAEKLPVKRALLDGEVCVLDERGLPDFGRLQNFRVDRRGLVYFAFDLLELEGADLRKEPLIERRRRLEPLLPSGGLLRFSVAFDQPPLTLLREITKLGGEGIVSKRAKSVYTPGERSEAWRKVKCTRRHDFVVGGFVELAGDPTAIGALFVGYYDGGHLVFAGQVGTGFSQADARALRTGLGPFEVPESPYDTQLPRADRVGVHWVQPLLVVQVEYLEITRTEHRLRHASFKGVCADRAAKDVQLEEPEE